LSFSLILITLSVQWPIASAMRARLLIGSRTIPGKPDMVQTALTDQQLFYHFFHLHDRNCISTG
jgi:hypothetical protein